MTTLYQTAKKSKKFMKHLKSTAHAFECQVYTFAKVHGMCFAGHQDKGLRNMFQNWTVLVTSIENNIEQPGQKIGMKKQTEGFLKKT